jgi:2-haloacid dehalogenase
MRPTVLSFDIFGTVVDWRRGLLAALGRQGLMLPDAAFDDVIDTQATAEDGPYATYAEITARSLETELGMAPPAAAEVAASIGSWPVYPDSPAALRRLLQSASCVAMTNSDHIHREPVERQLGTQLSAWVCAEELRLYKPDPRFWQRTAQRLGEALSPAWWHVSAYADYDLAAAHALGLTTVFVGRPHARPGSADHRVRDLGELAELVERQSA